MINNPSVVSANQPNQTFQGYTIFPFMSPTLNQGGNTAVMNANVVYGVQLVLPVPIIVRQCVFYINSGVTAAQYHYDFGIYTLAGSLLLHAPVTLAAGSSGAQSTVITPVTVQPGVYFYCWTADTSDISAQLYAQGGMDADMCKLLNALGSVYTFTADASVGGVLNSSLGTKVANDFTVGSHFPPMLMSQP